MENVTMKLPVLCSGEVQAVKGIEKSLSVGQVVWAPSTKGACQYLVFVGWLSDTRKLGIKYCYNRPCALYAVRAPLFKSDASGLELKWVAFVKYLSFYFTITPFFM
jgi:acylaminoacyl-peptidase